MKKFVLTVSLLLAAVSVDAQSQPFGGVSSKLVGIVPVLSCPTLEVVERIERACATIGADFTLFLETKGQGNCQSQKSFFAVTITDPSDPDLVTYAVNGPTTIGQCMRNQ